MLSLADYYAATGDAAFVKAMLPAGLVKMRRSYNRAMPKPPPAPGAPPAPVAKSTMQYAGWDERFNFAQLTPEGQYYPENSYIMRALYVRASRAFANLAKAAGNESLAATYRAEAATMFVHVRSGAGGETPGDEWWRPLGLHASAHAANAGLVNATEAPLVFAARFNESSKICSFSNFNQYFVLQGLANLGYPKHALASIELCWGAELALGATSFWEVSGYGGAWATAFGTPTAGGSPPVPGHSSGADSKCHPWAAGVTAWLTHEAAGLRPHWCDHHRDRPRSTIPTPTAICVTVRPLLDTVAATLPTLHGDVSISINAPGGSHSLSIPAGIELASVSLPLAGSCTSVESVTLDNVAAAGFAVVPAPWRRDAGLFDASLQLDIAGSLADASQARVVQVTVKCKHRGKAMAGTHELPAEVYGPPSWDIPMLGADATTQGSWVGRYGARGHQMFGLEGVNGSRNLAQPYIVGITWPSGGGEESNPHTGTITKVEPADANYAAALQLPCPSGPGSAAKCARGIGHLATRSIEPMAIEVTLRPAMLPASQHHCLNISLYFVDLTGVDDPITGSGAAVQHKTAVDVFTVAPGLEIDVGYATAVLGHPQLARGEYRTWRVCSDVLKPNATGFAAVRFRMYVVTGFNATVSAVFFD